jgi:hypothetical protein
MARPATVSHEEIIAAAEKLIAMGEKPTIARIRELLGDRGTPATIGRILKEWQQPAQSAGENSGMQQQSFEIELATTPKPADTSNTTPVGTEQNNAVFIEEQPSAPQSQTIEPTAEAKPRQEREAQPERREKLGFKQRRDEHRHREHDDNQHRHRERSDRDQDNNRHHNHHEQAAQSPTQNNYQAEVYQTENLDTMSEKELAVKIRRLETYLNKEQSRREAAEKMAREAKEYAEAIKEQIGQRITDLRQALEETVNQLKTEAREMKANSEADLKFYREQLDKANKKIISLLTDTPEQKG